MMSMKKSVLIVDDAAFIRKKLREILLEIDLIGDIQEAENGKEAIIKYKQMKPDLVTMDIIMPVMGGIEATEKIRNWDKDAKIIIISQVEKEEKVMEASQKGALDYIFKPFDKEQVKEKISRLLR